MIVTRSADILDVPIDRAGAMEIARRSRGTPRIANRMLRRVRDFAQVRAAGVITQKVADAALTELEVDELGLDSIDRRMLRAIMEFYGRRPRGLRHPGGHHQRGHGDLGGYVRAVPDAAGFPDPDAPGTVRDPEGLRTSGNFCPTRGGCPAEVVLNAQFQSNFYKLICFA